MPHRSQHVEHSVYVELVASLFAATVPSVIMSVGFVGSALLLWDDARDRVLLVLAVAGALASIVRLAVVFGLRRRACDPSLKPGAARRIERRFAASYLAFAAVLGAFGARVFLLPFPEGHMLVMCLLVGYGAGVAAGVALRPRIAIPSMLIAIVPTVLVGAMRDDPVYWATSAMTAALLAGGVLSLLDRHRRAREDIGRRIVFGDLARRDPLTGLPNRLALREGYEERMARRPAGLVAAHCLDLDGFKPVNDKHGHPTGDALLRAIARRLGAAVRQADLVARVGGDEFVVVQFGLTDAAEAELLAHRLSRIFEQPFQINQLTLRVSACIGYVVSADRTNDLETLIDLADQALYSAKREGGGVVRYEPPAPGEQFKAA